MSASKCIINLETFVLAFGTGQVINSLQSLTTGSRFQSELLQSATCSGIV